MSMLDYALDLVGIGLPVFPLRPLSKFPAIDQYPQLATTQVPQVIEWWMRNPHFNVGVSTDTLFAVDVDQKDGRRGGHTLKKLRAEGYEFPESYQQVTPSGGFHVAYSLPSGVRLSNTVGERGRGLGPGIDTRGKGGYLVGRGSVINDKPYVGDLRPLAPAPQWMLERFLWTGEIKEQGAREASEGVDQVAAEARSRSYLRGLSMVPKGGRNDAAYQAACYVRDYGLGEARCADLLREELRTDPSLDPEELRHATRSAYAYAQKRAGNAAPEIVFRGLIESPPPPPRHEAREDPEAPEEPGDHVSQMNRQYAYCLMGNTGRVLWETTDNEGRFELRSLTVDTLHDKMQGEVLLLDGAKKSQEISRIWMASPRRRTYDGVVFAPEQVVDGRFYNLWRGFAYRPLPEDQEPTDIQRRGLNALLEHAHENVCRGDAKLFRYLMGYFAHLVQRPWEKVLVALVFRGERGVGKDSLLDRMGALVGDHYLQCARERYLHSQFNAHLENLLLFGLNEAVWAFDKQHKGVLNDLITNPTHNIERKGQETYKVKNLLRMVIIGNDDTLVPASWDERRYACFDVGVGRKQDREFFHTMRVDMENGGYEYLLRYLLDFDIEGIDLNNAPDSQMLHEQKLEAMDPLHQWWRECLLDARIVCADFSTEWPADPMTKDSIRNAFRRWRKERGINGRDPHEQTFTKRLKECAPSILGNAKVERFNAYKFPELEVARTQWCKFIGFREEWPSE